MKNKENTENPPLLKLKEACALLGMDRSTLQRQIQAGKHKVEKITDNGGEQYRIPLSSLPPEAQAKWFFQQAQREIDRLGDPRTRAEQINAELRALAQKRIAEGKDPGKLDLEPVPVNQEEKEALWDRYDRAPAGMKQEAQRRYKVMLAYFAMEIEGVPKGAIEKAIQAEYGVSQPTLWRYRKAIKDQQDQGVWVPLLLPDWKGRTAYAEFTEAAWESIKEDWGRPHQPSLAACYRRAQKMAPAQGWVLPSLDAVESRINALPHWWRTARRKGLDALARCYPAQRRDYTGLKLHEIWCSDGRMADVFCRWPDGEISRPIVVAWLELRSRRCLGFEISKVENGDLIRLAFKNAAEASKAIPEAALLDNGHGFACKMLTGGQPTRYRFKVKEEDVPGILTLMGIQVIWATPGHGQAKPIESFWRTLAEADKRSEFAGAYCGNRPQNKPDDADKKNAVPVELYRRIVREEIDAYHLRTHRGDAMDGKTPEMVYAELLAYTPVRQPSQTQLRLCLLAAEALKPHREDSAFQVLGNRYWSEKCADLRRDRSYVVRFNPENAADPVCVYDGDKFLCEVPLITKSGFRDQQAAKDHNRARNRFIKSRKEQMKAAEAMSRAENWQPEEPETGNPTPEEPQNTAASLPTPKVARPVWPSQNYTHQPDEEEDDISPEELRELQEKAHANLMRKVAARGE